MSPSAQPTFARALLIPAVVTLALTALLLRPKAVPAPSVRPPLPTPVVLDELVPTSAAQGIEPAPPQPTRTQEGLRSLQAH